MLRRLDSPDEARNESSTKMVELSSMSGETIDNIKRQTNKLYDKLHGKSDNMRIKDLSENDIKTILSIVEQISTDVRQNYPEIEPSENGNSAPLDGNKIFVREPKGKEYFSIQLPLLFAKPYPGGQVMYIQIHGIIKQWMRAHRIEIPEHERLVLIYCRYINPTVARYVCDNDNFEQRKATNAIVDALNISDSYDVLSIMYTTKMTEAKECYYKAVLCSEDNFPEVLKTLFVDGTRY